MEICSCVYLHILDFLDSYTTASHVQDFHQEFLFWHVAYSALQEIVKREIVSCHKTNESSGKPIFFCVSWFQFWTLLNILSQKKRKKVVH